MECHNHGDLQMMCGYESLQRHHRYPVDVDHVRVDLPEDLDLVGREYGYEVSRITLESDRPEIAYTFDPVLLISGVRSYNLALYPDGLQGLGVGVDGND